MTCIFVSDAVKTDLGTAFRTQSLGEMTFKGKKKPVVVWEIAERLEKPKPSAYVERTTII
jgi:class 3 adenylate cyclase